MLGESVSAQPMAFVAGAENDDEESRNQLPFMLPVQPTEIAEAMEDFRRFSGRKQWEKAFKQLEKVFNSTSNGLVLTDNGILLPSRLVAREALLELPPAGHDAYKLFFDAEAKKLFEAAKGNEELEKLNQIFSKYLITSVGDEAANRLGDLHFEAGNFAQAVNAWRSILEERPDSRISKARLRVKMGIALARLRQWSEFQAVLRTVQEQHATEKMTIGGKEIVALEHLKSVGKKERDSASQIVKSANRSIPDFSLAKNPNPLWQFRFFPPQPDGNQPIGLRMQQMWGPQTSLDIVPPVTVDDSRAYVNLLGYNVGIDLKEGKLAWRSGRFFDLPQKAQQGGIQSVERFGIVKGADRIWLVQTDMKQPQQNQNMGMRNQNGAKFDIFARELATGKQIFSSAQVNDLKDYSLRGDPLLANERIFIAANKLNQPQDLFLLALNSKDGKLIWSSHIGTYTGQQNMWYGQVERTAEPCLLMQSDKIFIDTHAGTLIQLESVTGQIEWGLNYASEQANQNGRFWRPYNVQSERVTVSPPQLINGVLFIKGMHSGRLYAVDPIRPKVLWHRPVPKSAMFLGADEKRFYLGGEEISAYDLTTRKIAWSVQTNLGTSYANPLVTDGRIYHFSSHGIQEIDKKTGQVVNLFRGADRDSLGGELIMTPNALLAVSNLAITAYPVQPGGTKANTGGGNNKTASSSNQGLPAN